MAAPLLTTILDRIRRENAVREWMMYGVGFLCIACGIGAMIWGIATTQAYAWSYLPAAAALSATPLWRADCIRRENVALSLLEIPLRKRNNEQGLKAVLEFARDVLKIKMPTDSSSNFGDLL